MVWPSNKGSPGPGPEWWIGTVEPSCMGFGPRRSQCREGPSTGGSRLARVSRKTEKWGPRKCDVHQSTTLPQSTPSLPPADSAAFFSMPRPHPLQFSLTLWHLGTYLSLMKRSLTCTLWRLPFGADSRHAPGCATFRRRCRTTSRGHWVTQGCGRSQLSQLIKPPQNPSWSFSYFPLPRTVMWAVLPVKNEATAHA